MSDRDGENGPPAGDDPELSRRLKNLERRLGEQRPRVSDAPAKPKPPASKLDRTVPRSKS